MNIGLRLAVTALALCPMTLPASAQTMPDAGECAKCAVVFDIDGTLTPNVLAIWDARPDAAKAANLYAEAGVSVMYLSARTRLLQRQVPHWLDENGFPQGELHLTENAKDRADDAEFKTRILQGYQDDGWTIIAAYGDSSSDFLAYARAGLDQNVIYALRREGQDSCEAGAWRACLPGWTGHLDQITRDLEVLSDVN